MARGCPRGSTEGIEGSSPEGVGRKRAANLPERLAALGHLFRLPALGAPSEPRLGDLDNLALPIMDALKDVIYEDDRQVAELWVRRILLSAGPEYEGWPERLKQAAEVEREEFAYIQIDVMPEREMFL